MKPISKQSIPVYKVYTCTQIIQMLLHEGHLYYIVKLLLFSHK